MDFSKDLVLKENYTFFVSDAEAGVTGGEHGLYDRDTRFLSRYAWSFGEGVQTLLVHSPRPDRAHIHHALIEGPSQTVGIRRRLEIASCKLHDTLHIENTSLETRTVDLHLSLGADFVDMFEARGWTQMSREGIEVERAGQETVFRYRAKDGLEFATHVRFSHPPERTFRGWRAVFRFTLEPHETEALEVEIRLETPLEEDVTAMSYDAWREGIDLRTESEEHQEVLNQAVDDLRALLLWTEHGPLPAAGIPWYVAAFGRDSLLTAFHAAPAPS